MTSAVATRTSPVRAFALCLTATWAATLGGALVTAVGLIETAGREPHDALEAQPETVLALVAHNAPIVAWPFAVVAVGWHGLSGVRVVGDLLVAGQVVSHGAIVGAAIGEHPELWRYLPHLPLEWAAISASAAAWLHARKSSAVRGEVLRLVAATAVAVLSAAVVETYLVPL
jgi:hypothetical protein